MNDDKIMKQNMAREELKLKLLFAIREFKSEEYPDYKITNTDIINVLSSMVARRTQ